MSIADDQRAFYGELFKKFGDDPRALSQRDGATQSERFARMAKLFAGEKEPFSVHEVGCGLGHFGEFLGATIPAASYSGSEVNPDFVDACRQRFPASLFQLRDVSGETPADRYDFVTLCGVFNIPLAAAGNKWDTFIRQMLRSMYAMARKGISVDFLSSYCDADKMNPDLHYQSEMEILDFAAKELSRHFELDNSGPLYEYTLRVYRPEYLEAHYPSEEFSRYFKKPDQG